MIALFASIPGSERNRIEALPMPLSVCATALTGWAARMVKACPLRPGRLPNATTNGGGDGTQTARVCVVGRVDCCSRALEGANHEHGQDYRVWCVCCVRRRDGGEHGWARATAVRRSDRGTSPGGRWSPRKFDRDSLGCKRWRTQAARASANKQRRSL